MTKTNFQSQSLELTQLDDCQVFMHNQKQMISHFGEEKKKNHNCNERLELGNCFCPRATCFMVIYIRAFKTGLQRCKKTLARGSRAGKTPTKTLAIIVVGVK